MITWKIIHSKLTTFLAVLKQFLAYETNQLLIRQTKELYQRIFPYGFGEHVVDIILRSRRVPNKCFGQSKRSQKRFFWTVHGLNDCYPCAEYTINHNTRLREISVHFCTFFCCQNMTIICQKMVLNVLEIIKNSSGNSDHFYHSHHILNHISIHLIKFLLTLECYQIGV